MTPDPYTATEDDTLENVVEVLEGRRNQAPRCGARMIGIVNRRNLIHALTSLACYTPAPTDGDSEIRDRIKSVAGVKEVHDHMVWV